MNNILTPVEAQNFVKRLINAVFVDADIDMIRRSYAEDVIGHYGETNIDLNDIINRANYLKAVYIKRKHFLLEVITFANTVIFRDKQQAYNKENHQYLSVDLTGVYRIENDRVKEVWIMTDACFNYKANAEEGERDGIMHQPANIMQADVNTAYRMFTSIINKKLMTDYPQVELSRREMECLFYTLSGRSAKEIASILSLSTRTIEHYLEKLKLKLNCTSKSELRRRLVPGGIWL